MPPRVRFRPPNISTLYLRRAYSTPPQPAENPAPPPPKAAAKLTSRSLISVQGPDATKFLQGLITTSLPLPSSSGVFSSFLNPQADKSTQGRVLSDAFIYPTPHKDPSYLLEVDAATSHLIFNTLKRRKLRSKLTLRALPTDEYETWSIWNDADPSPTTLPTTTSSSSSSEISAPDNRAPGFGKRIIIPAHTFNPSELGIDTVGTDRYHLRRTLWGIPEGSLEITPEVALPQQSNIDYMGGIDYKKGCYVGQELTIRTHHTGVVRKRILPVQLYNTPPDTSAVGVSYDQSVVIPGIERGAQIKCVNRKSRAPGTLLSHIGNVGLALCRLETMTHIRLGEALPTEEHAEDDRFAVRVGEGGDMVYVKAFVPSWHKGSL